MDDDIVCGLGQVSHGAFMARDGVLLLFTAFLGPPRFPCQWDRGNRVRLAIESQGGFCRFIRNETLII